MRLSGHEINSQLRQKLGMPTGRRSSSTAAMVILTADVMGILR
jgi:hypothetical protein